MASTNTSSTAGGGAYVVAKRSINADRQARLEEQRKKKDMINSLENSMNTSAHPGSSSTMGRSIPANDGSPPFSPGREMDNDPAATRHAPLTEHERIHGKSKYESAEPYRSKKGDRFSDL